MDVVVVISMVDSGDSQVLAEDSVHHKTLDKVRRRQTPTLSTNIRDLGALEVAQPMLEPKDSNLRAHWADLEHQQPTHKLSPSTLAPTAFKDPPGFPEVKHITCQGVIISTWHMVEPTAPTKGNSLEETRSLSTTPNLATSLFKK